MRGSSKKPVINENIDADQVRLIGADGSQVGVVALEEAREVAADAKLDLVLISPDAEPPVCKVMDYGKYLFDLKKQKAANKKKQRRIHVKEIKFRPGTEEGDYQVKLRNLIRFLKDGDKTKVTMRFRGREHAHRELGLDLLRRVESDLVHAGDGAPDRRGAADRGGGADRGDRGPRVHRDRGDRPAADRLGAGFEHWRPATAGIRTSGTSSGHARLHGTGTDHR